MKLFFETLPAINTFKLAVGVPASGTYYCVNRFNNGMEYFAGQTFTLPVQGNLESIKLFAGMVYGQSKARLTVFELNAQNNAFTKKLAEQTQLAGKQQQGH